MKLTLSELGYKTNDKSISSYDVWTICLKYNFI
jgi:hypothetical protein